MDVTHISKSHANIYSRTVVAESCHIDLNSEQMPERDVNSENFIRQTKDKEKNLSRCLGAEEENIAKNHSGTISSQTQSSKHIEQKPSKRRSWESKQAVFDAPSTPSKSPFLSQNCSPNDESWSMDPI